MIQNSCYGVDLHLLQEEEVMKNRVGQGKLPSRREGLVRGLDITSRI